MNQSLSQLSSPICPSSPLSYSSPSSVSEFSSHRRARRKRFASDQPAIDKHSAQRNSMTANSSQSTRTCKAQSAPCLSPTTPPVDLSFSLSSEASKLKPGEKATIQMKDPSSISELKELNTSARVDESSRPPKPLVQKTEESIKVGEGAAVQPATFVTNQANLNDVKRLEKTEKTTKVHSTPYNRITCQTESVQSLKTVTPTKTNSVLQNNDEIKVEASAGKDGSRKDLKMKDVSHKTFTLNTPGGSRAAGPSLSTCLSPKAKAVEESVKLSKPIVSLLKTMPPSCAAPSIKTEELAVQNGDEAIPDNGQKDCLKEIRKTANLLEKDQTTNSSQVPPIKPSVGKQPKDVATRSLEAVPQKKLKRTAAGAVLPDNTKSLKRAFQRNDTIVKNTATSAQGSHQAMDQISTPALASATIDRPPPELTLEEIQLFLPKTKCSQKCKTSCFNKAKRLAKSQRTKSSHPTSQRRRQLNLSTPSPKRLSNSKSSQERSSTELDKRQPRNPISGASEKRSPSSNIVSLNSVEPNLTGAPSPSINACAESINVRPVGGGKPEAGSSSKYGPVLLSDKQATYDGGFNDTKSPEGTQIVSSSTVLVSNHQTNDSTTAGGSASTSSKTIIAPEAPILVKAGGRVAQTIAPRPSMPMGSVKLPTEALHSHDAIILENDTQDVDARDWDKSPLQETSTLSQMSPAGVKSEVQCSPPSEDLSMQQHCSVQLGANTDTTSLAPIEGNLQVEAQALEDTPATEVVSECHFEIEPALDLPCTLPLDMSGELPDLNKLFTPFAPKSPQLTSSADECAMDVAATEMPTEISNAIPSSPETPAKKTSRRARQAEKSGTKGYKAKSVVKRKLTSEEKAVAELEAERRIPIDLPHKDGDHVTIWNRREQRKVAGNAAPLRRNLKKYFMEHPECEVYVNQKAEPRPSGQNGRVNGGGVSIERHISLWHKYENRKVAGNAAPLEKNLKEYLKFHPEYEVYSGQDKSDAPRTNLTSVDEAPGNDVIVKNEAFEINAEEKPDYTNVETSTTITHKHGMTIKDEDCPWAEIVDNMNAVRDAPIEPISSENIPSSVPDSDIDMFILPLDFGNEFECVEDADPSIKEFVDFLESGTELERTEVCPVPDELINA